MKVKLNVNNVKFKHSSQFYLRGVRMLPHTLHCLTLPLGGYSSIFLIEHCICLHLKYFIKNKCQFVNYTYSVLHRFATFRNCIENFKKLYNVRNMQREKRPISNTDF